MTTSTISVSSLQCFTQENNSIIQTDLGTFSFREVTYTHQFLVSYPGMMAQGWSGGPESGTGQTSCESGSQEDSHLRTEIGSKKTGCGWCAADWTAS